MQINEIMTSAPIKVRETASIDQAWRALQALDIRHLPVVNADGELVGIVSDRDFATPPAPPLMGDLLGNGSPSPDASVSTIMTGAPISVEADDELGEAIDLMVENKIGAIPVVDPEGQVVGIVSYLDVLRGLRNEVEPAEGSAP